MTERSEVIIQLSGAGPFAQRTGRRHEFTSLCEVNS
jgi:hypothetical protein